MENPRVHKSITPNRITHYQSKQQKLNPSFRSNQFHWQRSQIQQWIRLTQSEENDPDFSFNCICFFSSGFCLEVKKITFSSDKVEEFKADEIDPCFEFHLKDPPPRCSLNQRNQEVTRHSQLMLLIETHFSSRFFLEYENIAPSSSLPDFCHTGLSRYLSLCMEEGVRVWA